MNLNEIRVNIDNVDNQLKELFIKRMELVKEVYKYKKENNLPVKNNEREAEIIEKRTSDLSEFKDETGEFFKDLIDISCKYQEQRLNTKNKLDTDFEFLKKEDFFKTVKKVAYQGIKGSYGSEMANKLFEGKELIGFKSFREVCEKVKEGQVSVGVLPVENLSAGSVSEVYDLIFENNLTVVMEEELEIRHCLLGKGSYSEIERVKSHPQALSQCSGFLKEHNFETIEGVNTAVCAYEASVYEDATLAVISSKINSEYYNLKVLKENISDIEDNKTRFVVVSRDKIILDSPQKISLVFTLPHKRGSLARVLGDFSNHSFNLTKIESRPIKSNVWEYNFYVDIEGSLMDGETKAHLEKISYLFDEIKILGNY